MSVVDARAKPYCLEGNKGIFCLLIHGFTGSPADMSVLARHLHMKGYSVSGILLPGHGTTPQEMAKTSWSDWYGAVEDEYMRLKSRNATASVIPMGLSMGGLLALHLASRHRVQGVVTFSAPVYMADPRVYKAESLQLEFFPKEKSPAEIERDRREGRFSYNVIPLKPLSSLLELIDIVKKELGQIKVPALCLQSRDDSTVRAESACYLYEHLGSTAKRLVWLEKSGHVITLGSERDKVFMAVEEFLNNFVAPKGGGASDV